MKKCNYAFLSIKTEKAANIKLCLKNLSRGLKTGSVYLNLTEGNFFKWFPLMRRHLSQPPSKVYISHITYLHI